MNEKEFGEQIARLLQSTVKQIDDGTSARLKSARLAALARYEEKAPAHGLALAGAKGERLGSVFHFSQRPLLWAPIVAALLALGITAYWQESQRDADDVDAFLLASDLPVQAFIDKDFDAWLKGSAR